MNELKPEDVMPEGAVVEALEIRAPHDAVCRYALALLRGKDAEIERLRAQNETLEINNKNFKYRIYELSRDNEEWEHENKDLECDNDMLRERITEIKADTVRKVHSEIKDRCMKGGIYPAFVASTIDQITKEMLEGRGRDCDGR